MKALVIGGTGPTGPYVVKGLLERGYEVTIFHRGGHEVDLPPEVRHVHGDPFDIADMERVLTPIRVDLVVASYGRLRHIAGILAGHTARVIAITGSAGYLGLLTEEHHPDGMPLPVPEDAPTYEDQPDLSHFGFLVVQGEKALIERHNRGDYVATILRYPEVYGPRDLSPRLWPVLRRALDRRPHIVIPGEGLRMMPNGYAENVAHAVLLAVDQPEKAAGQAFNVADERVLSLRRLVQLVARSVGHDWDIVQAHHPLAEVIARSYTSPPHHIFFDIFKIKQVLGYRDVVPPVEAVHRTVQWMIGHRSLVEAEAAKTARDPYDYELEDRFIAAYRKGMVTLSEAFPPLPPREKKTYAYHNE